MLRYCTLCLLYIWRIVKTEKKHCPFSIFSYPFLVMTTIEDVCQKHMLIQKFIVTIAESFYNLKYWTSIITSNARQINLCNENIKNKHWWVWCFQISKIVSQWNHFANLIYILSWKHLLEIYFRLLRRNNN